MVSVDKEWKIPQIQTQEFCPENFFSCGSTKSVYREKSFYARHGHFSQVYTVTYLDTLYPARLCARVLGERSVND